MASKKQCSSFLYIMHVRRIIRLVIFSVRITFAKLKPTHDAISVLHCTIITILMYRQVNSLMAYILWLLR